MECIDTMNARHRVAMLALFAVLPALASAQGVPGASPPPMAPETVLADNGIARVTRADYDLELTRLPEAMRSGFATSEKRVADLINRLLVTRTLAVRADEAKLIENPEIARRLAYEFERIKSKAMA